MSQPRVGLELIVYGERVQEDLAGVLAEVSQVGYAGIEGAALVGREQTEQMQAGLEATGLAYAAGHCAFRDLGDREGMQRRIESVRSLGGRYLITSGNHQWGSLDDYRQAAKSLEEVGRLCKAAGLTFCFHNHHWELKEFDGERGIHVLMAESDPELVKLCPDVYWVQVGGEPPADFITRYRERCPYFHFKDGLGGEQYREFRELGEGSVDMKAALEAALACDPDWIVVEQDRTDKEPIESNRISREYLKGLGV